MEGALYERKGFAVEQIVAVLQEAGMPVADAFRHIGISEQTFYRWKKQCAGFDSDQARQLKQLQEENERLKKIVAEISLSNAMLLASSKKVVRMDKRRVIVDYLKSSYSTSERRACRLVGKARRVHGYKSGKDPKRHYVSA
jgi:putative transposase